MKLTIADLDAELGDAEQAEPFEFERSDGVTVRLPSMREIPAEILIDLDPADGVRFMLRLLNTKDFAGLLKSEDMNMGRLSVLAPKYVDWLNTAGLGGLGKGAASPRSSNGTGPRSRPTSRVRAGH